MATADPRKKLQDLQKEFEAGQKMLAQLAARQQELTATLLRIEGGMQVLREIIGSDDAEVPANGAPAEPGTPTA